MRSKMIPAKSPERYRDMAQHQPQPAELSAVQELVAINENHVASLESVSDAIEDRGLGQVLADFAYECEQLNEQLKNWIESTTVELHVDDHTCDPIENAISDREPRSRLLASAEQTEQNIIQHYLTALDRIEHPDLRQVLFQQYDHLQNIQHWLHRVRLAVAA